MPVHLIVALFLWPNQALAEPCGATVAPVDYSRCLREAEADDAIHARLVEWLATRTGNDRKPAIDALRHAVLAMGGVQRERLSTALTRQGWLAAEQLPSPEEIEALLESHLSIEPSQRKDIQTTYSDLECFHLRGAPDRLVCDTKVVQRITPRDCHLEEGKTVFIRCKTDWCVPCARTGLETTLRLVSGHWTVQAQVQEGLLEHGCGFGCMDFEF